MDAASNKHVEVCGIWTSDTLLLKLTGWVLTGLSGYLFRLSLNVPCFPDVPELFHFASRAFQRIRSPLLKMAYLTDGAFNGRCTTLVTTFADSSQELTFGQNVATFDL